MEIKMITGCTANYLGIDGKSEVDMTDEQRLNAWKYITKAMNEHTPKSDDLNQLLQFLLSQWGECCGDTVDEATLVL